MRIRQCIRCDKIFKTELKYKEICDNCIKSPGTNVRRPSEYLHNQIHKHREYLRKELKLDVL